MGYRGTVYRLGSTQTAAYTSASASVSSGFATGTQVVRVSATTGCYIKFGSSPSATTSDAYLKGGEPEYFVVTPGQKVAAIRTSTNGTLTVTECSG